ESFFMKVMNLWSEHKIPINFYKLQWSGANTAISRERAANELSNHIQIIRNTHKNSFHFIIGHSHGGNVILYSMKQRTISCMVDGVICISTPFIVPINRYYGCHPALLISIISFSIGSILTLLLMIMISPTITIAKISFALICG